MGVVIVLADETQATLMVLEKKGIMCFKQAGTTLHISYFCESAFSRC
jgi:hypothetical protein